MQERLDEYSKLFDVYLSERKFPETYQKDVLACYIKEVLDDPGNYHLCSTNQVWKDLLKDSLLNFIRQLLPYIMKLEAEEAEEKKYIKRFKEASLIEKRKAWIGLNEYIVRHYSPSEVHMEGYISLLKNGSVSKDVVFETMTKEWKKACEKRIEKEKKRLLDRNKAKYKEWFSQAGKVDYQMVKNTELIFHKYPQLKEIVQLMGREKENKNEEKDSLMARYIPLLLSHSTSKEEIEGIRTGNALNNLLPTEVTWLSDFHTELLFYQKFASNQLQLFASKSPNVQRMKTELQRQKEPRLQEGPIIMSIDTSASMNGTPEKIAKSIMMQILQMAKQKHRKCFLITYSVRSQTLEISKSEHWEEVKSFVKNVFTGGTDGESMLADVLEALQTDNYLMADVLVISDFEFEKPMSNTLKRIQEEQKKGTRFYGLQIGSSFNVYEKILNKIWVVK